MASVLALGGNPGQGVDLSISPKNVQGPFRPNGIPSTKTATTTSSQAFPLPRNYNADDCVRVYNSSASIQRIKFGRDNTVVATAFDKGVAPNSIETFRIGTNVNWVAVIGDAAGSIEFACGHGL